MEPISYYVLQFFLYFGLSVLILFGIPVFVYICVYQGAKAYYEVKKKYDMEWLSIMTMTNAHNKKEERKNG